MKGAPPPFAYCNFVSNLCRGSSHTQKALLSSYQLPLLILKIQRAKFPLLSVVRQHEEVSTNQAQDRKNVDKLSTRSQSRWQPSSKSGKWIPTKFELEKRGAESVFVAVCPACHEYHVKYINHQVVGGRISLLFARFHECFPLQPEA